MNEHDELMRQATAELVRRRQVIETLEARVARLRIVGFFAAVFMLLTGTIVGITGPRLSGATLFAVIVIASGGYVMYLSWKEPYP